jgi:hypothetical protein
MRFDHEEIRRTSLRSWSRPLFAALTDTTTTEDERQEIVDSLRELDDSRHRGELVAVLTSRSIEDSIRLAAKDVLDWSEDYLSSTEWLALWNLNDPLLNDVALRHVDDASIVMPLAEDPTHALHGAAIIASRRLDEHMHLAVAALSHPSAEVRDDAIFVVMWDEPINAVEPLLRCLDDESEKVRREAENVLQYFTNRRVLAKLAERGGSSFESLRDDFRNALTDTPALSSWMEPVRQFLGDFVEPPVEAAAEQPADVPSEPKAAPATIDVPILLNLLRNENCSAHILREEVRRFQWESVSPTDHTELFEAMGDHSDPVVRYTLANVLAVWGDTEKLCALVDDRSETVRGSARYILKDAPKTSRAASRLLADLQSPSRSVNWSETLTSYLHHANHSDGVAFLVDRMHSTRSWSERWHCLVHLIALRETEHVRAALPWFDGPPQVNWQIHISLLHACQQLGLPLPTLPDPNSIDDLAFATAVLNARPFSADR